MYAHFLTSEFKKWLRDPIMRFMLMYPVIFGIIGRFILPWAAESAGFQLEHYADMIIVILTLMTPHVFGAITGFSILDDRDDSILSSIQVTPMGIHRFLSFRLIMVLTLSLLACVYVIWFSDIGDMPPGKIFSISFLASLGAPLSGLLINALAKNKIEGFAVMKGTGIILIFPILALFFIDRTELLFSPAPGFWPAKAISSVIRGEGTLYLDYQQYYFIGLFYAFALNALMYRLFMQKTQV